MLLWLHGGAYCLGSCRTHRAAGCGAGAARRGSVRRCRTTGWRPSTRSRPRRGRPRRLGCARRRGLGAGPDRARRRQRRRRARLRAAGGAARRGRRAGGAGRLQPVDRPDPVRPQPPADGAQAMRCCRPSACPRCGTSTWPGPTRPIRGPRRTAPTSPARRRCWCRRAGRDPRRRRPDDRRPAGSRRRRSTSSPACRTSGSSGTAICRRRTRRWTAPPPSSGRSCRSGPDVRRLRWA